MWSTVAPPSPLLPEDGHRGNHQRLKNPFRARRVGPNVQWDTTPTHRDRNVSRKHSNELFQIACSEAVPVVTTKEWGIKDWLPLNNSKACSSSSRRSQKNGYAPQNETSNSICMYLNEAVLKWVIKSPGKHSLESMHTLVRQTPEFQLQHTSTKPLRINCERTNIQKPLAQFLWYSEGDVYLVTSILNLVLHLLTCILDFLNRCTIATLNWDQNAYSGPQVPKTHTWACLVGHQSNPKDMEPYRCRNTEAWLDTYARSAWQASTRVHWGIQTVSMGQAGTFTSWPNKLQTTSVWLGWSAAKASTYAHQHVMKIITCTTPLLSVPTHCIIPTTSQLRTSGREVLFLFPCTFSSTDTFKDL